MATDETAELESVSGPGAVTLALGPSPGPVSQRISLSHLFSAGLYLVAFPPSEYTMAG